MLWFLQLFDANKTTDALELFPIDPGQEVKSVETEQLYDDLLNIIQILKKTPEDTDTKYVR